MTELPPIPTYWTGQQALEVVDFLEQIVNAIWWAHGDRMTAAARTLPSAPDDSDDRIDYSNLPF